MSINLKSEEGFGRSTLLSSYNNKNTSNHKQHNNGKWNDWMNGAPFLDGRGSDVPKFNELAYTVLCQKSIQATQPEYCPHNF
mmetsp:Transcript_16949/g.22083  ORF Transcript_16949/g.22083 Transcript_16949/m.22083 type:complete len:82 (+) Transcript_16949:129-374(+)